MLARQKGTYEWLRGDKPLLPAACTTLGFLVIAMARGVIEGMYTSQVRLLDRPQLRACPHGFSLEKVMTNHTTYHAVPSSHLLLFPLHSLPLAGTVVRTGLPTPTCYSHL